MKVIALLTLIILVSAVSSNAQESKLDSLQIELSNLNQKNNYINKSLRI